MCYSDFTAGAEQRRQNLTQYTGGSQSWSTALHILELSLLPTYLTQLINQLTTEVSWVCSEVRGVKTLQYAGEWTKLN